MGPTRASSAASCRRAPSRRKPVVAGAPARSRARTARRQTSRRRTNRALSSRERGPMARCSPCRPGGTCTLHPTTRRENKTGAVREKKGGSREPAGSAPPALCQRAAQDRVAQDRAARKPAAPAAAERVARARRGADGRPGAVSPLPVSAGPAAAKKRRGSGLLPRRFQGSGPPGERERG